MSDDDMMLALGRIERALSRLEAIEQAPADRTQDSAASALAERHDRLRDRVGAALDRIDSLITGPRS